MFDFVSGHKLVQDVEAIAGQARGITSAGQRGVQCTHNRCLLVTSQPLVGLGYWEIQWTISMEPEEADHSSARPYVSSAPSSLGSATLVLDNVSHRKRRKLLTLFWGGVL